MTGADVGTGARQSQADARATTSVGMAVALGAMAMTFASLLLAYAIVRAQAPVWPPPVEPSLPNGSPWPLFAALATAAALGGSAAMRAAGASLRSGGDNIDDAASGSRRLRRALAIAALAEATFVAIQITWWARLVGVGFLPQTGLVASVVYALTIFHAAHALAALIAVGPLWLAARRGRAVRAGTLAAVTSFFHLVTAAWLVVFFAVYVA